MRSGFSPPVTFASIGHIAEISWNTPEFFCRSSISGCDIPTFFTCCAVKSSCTATSSCGAGNGKGRRSTASTTENSAVFAPIPNARVSSATTVNPRFCRRARNPYLRSCPASSIHSQLIRFSFRPDTQPANHTQSDASPLLPFLLSTALQSIYVPPFPSLSPLSPSAYEHPRPLPATSNLARLACDWFSVGFLV